MEYIPLHALSCGKWGIVEFVNSNSPLYRRMLDLGITEGTPIQNLMRSPSGDPTAYIIRGAVIALRKKDAADILVSDCTSTNKLTQN